MSNYKLYMETEMYDDEFCCEAPCIHVRNGLNVCINCGMVHDIYMVEEERRAYGKEEYL